jgi:hypothetical protein
MGGLRRDIMLTSTRALMPPTVLAWMGTGGRSARAAPVTVRFSATIFQSAFSAGDLAVGKTITGYYTYDTDALPDLGLNYANYTLLGASSSAGLNTWSAGLAELELAHSTGCNALNSDAYEVWGYSLTGPSIEGFRPAFSALFMVDTDASAYADLSFPVAFPDPGLFETKDFFLVFLEGSGERAEVGARIDSIRVAPEEGSFTQISLGVLGLLGRVWQRRKQGKAHKLRT